jgi:hypothetical protein
VLKELLAPRGLLSAHQLQAAMVHLMVKNHQAAKTPVVVKHLLLAIQPRAVSQQAAANFRLHQ